MVDALESKLAKDQWLGGAQPSAADREAIESMTDAPCPASHPNTFAWWCLASRFTAQVRATWAGAAAPAKDAGKKGGKKEEPKKEAPKKEAAKKADDDDFDPFADEDDGGETLAEQQARFDAIAAAAKKNAKKVVNKSLIVWDVKPWGEDTDLDEMARLILSIKQEGLDWKTEYKKEPVAYGVFKVQIGATITDDLVSTDEIQEKIEAFEDHVQSVDIVTFQKLWLDSV